MTKTNRYEATNDPHWGVGLDHGDNSVDISCEAVRVMRNGSRSEPTRVQLTFTDPVHARGFAKAFLEYTEKAIERKVAQQNAELNTRETAGRTTT